MIATVGLVTLISAALIVGGLFLFWLTLWFWKNSRVEPEALAPLEIMSERAYAKSKGVDRAFLLNMVRPSGAAVPYVMEDSDQKVDDVNDNTIEEISAVKESATPGPIDPLIRPDTH
jgi:hypothetical protein